MQKKKKNQANPWSEPTPVYRPETWWDRLGKRTVGGRSPGVVNRAAAQTSTLVVFAYWLFVAFVGLQILTTPLNGVKAEERTHDLFLGFLSRWGIQYQVPTKYIWYGLAAAFVVYICVVPNRRVLVAVNLVVTVVVVAFLIYFFLRPTL